MTVSLSKGENVNLSKEDVALAQVKVGLGWKTPAENFDLDASAFLLGENRKVLSEKDFVFYGNKESANGAVKSSGDNRTGIGEGDDETISIDLENVPANVQSIAIAVTIHEAQERGQNFGQVGDAYIRIVNAETDVELAKFDLDEDASGDTAIVFGSLYRHGIDWKFKANASGSKATLTELATTFGVAV